MALVNVLNWKNEQVGKVELSDEVFATDVKKDILHTVVQWQLSARRQGTHMTKTKGLVRGGGKKPFKQKGTGNARQGSSRSPLMPGGGTMFGPQPRSYSFVLPKKVRKLGLKMALSYLQKEGRLFVVENMKSEGKTAELNKRLKGFGIKKAVLIDIATNEHFARAARNLESFKFLAVEGVNVFDLLKYDSVIVAKDALTQLADRCTVKGA